MHTVFTRKWYLNLGGGGGGAPPLLGAGVQES